MFFGRGLDFPSCRFWAEGENPCIFTWFLLFFIKSAKACEANFHRCWLQFLWQPEPKKEPFWLEIYKVFWFSEKKGLFAKPLLVGGGSMWAPRDTKRAQSLHFYSVFLSCTKSKKGPRNRLSRGQVGNFLGPQVPRRGTLPAFLQCFLFLTSRKPAFLQGFGALGHLQRATRDTKREKTTQFYLHFCRVLVSWVKRWKGDWVKGTKGNWEKRVLGTWVLGFWGFIRRGELVRGRPDRREKEPKCGHCRGPKGCRAKSVLQDWYKIDTDWYKI